MNLFTKLKNPFYVQGNIQLPHYFEGWYFKQVNLELNRTISFIFGFSTNKEDPHAFIQVIHSHPLRTYYFTYPLDSFFMHEDGYRLGTSFFAQDRFNINIQENGFSCVGELHFLQITALEHTFYMPNIMGPFAYIGKMECNHGVVSMHHKVKGVLKVNDETWTFNNDIGYIEKDWGRSFPKRYIWLQGNHFHDPSTHLMVSVADIPFGLFHFEGLIAQLNHPLYTQRLATYTLARKKDLIKTENGFMLTLKQGRIKWVIEVQIQEKADLVSPQNGKMKNIIKEGLGGQIKLSVFDRNQLLFEDISQHCGIEIEAY